MEPPQSASLSSFQASVDESLAKFHVTKSSYLFPLQDKENDDDSRCKKANNCIHPAKCWPAPRRILSRVKFALNTFSRKVFVGGLPPDISTDEISARFSSFGIHKVDWPHKSSTDLFPPKGFAFLLYAHEESVHHLLAACEVEGPNLFFFVSSVSTRNKKVQVRPWCLQHNDTFLNNNMGKPLNPRTTLFVGGVPRLLKAQELADIMNNAFGHVCYAGIDVDPWMKYPKGSGRVCFSNDIGYMKALKTRFVHLKTDEVDKQVEVKPFVLCDQECDDCKLSHQMSPAVFFCPNLTCLKYFCEKCWTLFHKVQKHQPLIISPASPFTARSTLQPSSSKLYLQF